MILNSYIIFDIKGSGLGSRDRKRRCKAQGAWYTGKLRFGVESFGVHSPRLAASSSYRRTPDKVRGRCRYPENPTGFPRIEYGAGQVKHGMTFKGFTPPQGSCVPFQDIYP